MEEERQDWPIDGIVREIEAPFPGMYWVEPRLFLAGKYPGERTEDGSRRGLRRLLQEGIQSFVDLTQPGEFGLKPYADLLAEEAAGLGSQVEYHSFPTLDKSVPEAGQMSRILDLLDRTIGLGRGVYVHCCAGIGRTGTVVGCYMVRHGVPGGQALERIARLRRGTWYEWVESPKTEVQKGMVLGWAQGQ